MKTRLVALVLALAVVLGLRRWMGRGRSLELPPAAGDGAAGDVAFASPKAHDGSRAAAARHPRLDRAAADRVRDQLRLLFAEAAADSGDAASGPLAPHADAAHAPAPSPPPPAGRPEARVDPKYIEARMREDFFPLAQDCYTQALGRQPHLAGRIELAVTIVGDPSVGGVVGEASFGPGTTIADAEMQRCVRESLMSATFAAPPGGHEVRVVYPIPFANDGGQ
jgi:hypothetical protein